MIKCSLKSEDADSEEIQILNHREWIYKLWDNLKYRNWDLTKFKDVHLIPTNRSTLRKLNTPKKIFSNENISINLRHIFEKFGGVFVEHEFDVGRISRWNKITSYIIKPDDIISVLGSFRADTSYPRNLSQTTLQTYEASTLANHLSNHLRLVNKVQIMNYIEVIKYLSIFFEVDHDSPISLLPENTNWYLLPRNEENTCGKIIYPRNMGKFLNTSSQNLSYILEDIIKITRLDSYVYWQKYVIPYLGSQQQAVIDKVVDSLFDRLPFLLDHDVNLKDVLGRTSFVPVGTYKMSQQQEMPARVKLVKPTELFDPEDMTVVGLFFEEEQVFPAGRYGIPRNKFSNKFFSNLKLLGMKSDLSSND
ncbi:15240_t:CDS:2, partial [Funneliformis caledonium]